MALSLLISTSAALQAPLALGRAVPMATSRRATVIRASDPNEMEPDEGW